MSLSTFLQGFLDGFTPGWPRARRRPGAPDYMFAQDESDGKQEQCDTSSCGHCGGTTEPEVHT